MLESRLFEVGVSVSYGIGEFFNPLVFFVFVQDEEAGKINPNFILNWKKLTT